MRGLERLLPENKARTLHSLSSNESRKNSEKPKCPAHSGFSLERTYSSRPAQTSLPAFAHPRAGSPVPLTCCRRAKKRPPRGFSAAERMASSPLGRELPPARGIHSRHRFSGASARPAAAFGPKRLGRGVSRGRRTRHRNDSVVRHVAHAVQQRVERDGLDAHRVASPVIAVKPSITFWFVLSVGRSPLTK